MAISIVVWHTHYYDWEAHPDHDAVNTAWEKYLTIANVKEQDFTPEQRTTWDEVRPVVEQQRSYQILLGHDNRWRRKAAFQASQGVGDSTQFVISDDQLRHYQEYDRIHGFERSLAEIVLDHLKGKFRHHMHPSHITRVQVEGDSELHPDLPAIEEYLNKVLDQAAPAAAAAEEAKA